MALYKTGRCGGWPEDLSDYQFGDLIEDDRGIHQMVVQFTYDVCGHTRKSLQFPDESGSYHRKSAHGCCAQCGYPGSIHAGTPAVADVLQRMMATGESQDDAVRSLGGEA